MHVKVKMSVGGEEEEEEESIKLVYIYNRIDKFTP
jgi:hypothetical protein